MYVVKMGVVVNIIVGECNKNWILVGFYDIRLFFVFWYKMILRVILYFRLLFFYLFMKKILYFRDMFIVDVMCL